MLTTVAEDGIGEEIPIAMRPKGMTIRRHAAEVQPR